MFFPEQEWSELLQRAIPRSAIAGRTGTWEQAQAMHQEVCARRLAAIPGATAGETVVTQPPEPASLQPDMQ